MPVLGKVGDIVQPSGEVTIEWNIKDFLSLSGKEDDGYNSTVFSYADALWYLQLYPNGKTKSEEWVGLYCIREDSGPPKTLRVTFGIKNFNEKEFEYKFQEENEGHGYFKFCLRSELQNQVSSLMPKNVLTITCRLKCSDTNIVKVSLGNRVRKVSSNMKKILNEGKRADFTLKLGDREWPVHKVILESRCEYFENMFRHDWLENTVGEVTFDDMEEDTLDSVLHFLYSGVVDGMSVKNVCEIYVAAHKFLLDDLKALCIEYTKKTMCVEIVSKALVIADTYEEGDLKESAIEYFTREAGKIFDSEQWKEFKKSYPFIATEVLEESTKKELKKRAKE